MVDRAVIFSEKSRKEGLLSLEDELPQLQKKKEILAQHGMYSIIEKLLKILMKLDKDNADKDKEDIENIFARLVFKLMHWEFSIEKKKLSKLIKDEKDFFEYGIFLLVQGLDMQNDKKIARLLENIISREKNRTMRVLKSFTADAFTLIQKGGDPKCLYGALDYILACYDIYDAQ